MIDKRSARDRRCETRWALAGTILWRAAGSDRTFFGWLSDTSRSSLSFIATSQNAPSFGEVIDVAVSDRCRYVFRTTRIAPYDDDLSLIACRNVTVAESRIDKTGGTSLGFGLRRKKRRHASAVFGSDLVETR